MHPINGTDDDVIKFQQARDLGHDGEEGSAKPARETEAARIESDARANKALGRDLYGRRRAGETRKALNRPAR